MVNFCAIVGCGKRSDRDKGISFYRLPAEIIHQGERTQDLSKKRRALWISRIHRANFKPTNHTRVCSRHFVGGKPSPLYEETSPDWAPSLFLGGAPEPTASVPSRYERVVERREKRKRLDACHALLQLSQEPDQEPDQEAEESEQETEQISASCQTDMQSSDIEKMKEDFEKLKKDYHELLLKTAGETAHEVQALTKREVFGVNDFRGNDEKVRFFTGLTNWEILSKLFDFVRSYLIGHQSLTPFQQLMITLMRLRLASSGVELGYHFSIHPSTLSRIFSRVIEILYVRLNFLIVWPEREVLRKTLPMDFRKNCPRCVAIIDCFEIFIDRPSDLLARAQTYSSYKHHNTVKFLIAITPQGSVSYISDGWGGRASDKHITDKSSLLHNLLPGDTILADRGFDIKDSLGLYSATVTIPAFTKGKKQLEGIDVEQTRTIANVRIHVERVIGNIRKKYTILGTTQPIDYLIIKNNVTLLDMIVTVCCALNNLCNSVIPFD